MGELARGTVADRPWGRTLGALGLRGLSGAVTLIAEGKRYKIGFRGGAIVGAHSPLASDSAARVALTGNLISSTQVAEIVRKLTAAGAAADEIEVIAEQARLMPEQALRLRRRVVAQRAARTFSIERGDFIVEDALGMDVVPGTEMDVRAVIYLGARQNLSEARLASELGQFGAWFKLKDSAVDDLAQFGFSAAEKPVLELLLAGADLRQLEAAGAGIEQRTVRAVVYALASCNACDIEALPRSTVSSNPGIPLPHDDQGSGSGRTRAARAFSPTGAPTQQIPTQRTGATSTNPPIATSRTTTPSKSRAPTNPGIATSRTTTPSKSRTPTPVATPVVPSATPTAPATPTPTPATGTPLASGSGVRTPHPSPRPHTNPAGPANAYPIPTTPSTKPSPLPAATSSSNPSGIVSLRPPNPGGANRQPISNPIDDPDNEDELLTLRPEPMAPVGSGPTKRAPTMQPIAVESSLSADGATVLRPRKKAPSRDPELRAKQAAETKALIKTRAKVLAKNGDHFAILGVETNATPEVVRAAYFALARQLHPDKLAALGVPDEDRNAHMLFARVNTSFAVLNDPRRRYEYEAILARGGEAAVAAEQAKAEQLAMRALEAENAYRRGEMALRRDQLTTALAEFKKALELDPETADYQAMVAWTQFCASPDKMAASRPTREALERAIKMSPRAATAYVVLGRMERMIGRDADAKRHFEQVLKMSPGHTDALSELRGIEARLAQPPKR